MTPSSSQFPQAAPQAIPGAMAGQDPDLELRYGEYRRRQAAGLISLLPREAVRPLYARAREWRRAAGLVADDDPLAVLLLFLERVLPLPPLEVWADDRLENPGAHLREEFESHLGQSRPTPPLTVESRPMDVNGGRWRASLNLCWRNEAWRGFIAFHPAEGGESLRTAEIFREEDPEEIRTRFLGYQNHTLQAFLRSVSPG